jgi:hypothetical protein
MPTRIEVYRGHQLKAIEQPNGMWMVEIVPIGGGGREAMTQPYALQDDAMAAARRTLDNRGRAAP